MPFFNGHILNLFLLPDLGKVVYSLWFGLLGFHGSRAIRVPCQPGYQPPPSARCCP